MKKIEGFINEHREWFSVYFILFLILLCFYLLIKKDIAKENLFNLKAKNVFQKVEIIQKM
jgi:uncharacterized membrane protein YfcA